MNKYTQSLAMMAFMSITHAQDTNRNILDTLNTYPTKIVKMKQHNEYTTYCHPDGSVSKEGNYQQGVKQGIWIIYSDNIRVYQTYQNGKLNGRSRAELHITQPPSEVFLFETRYKDDLKNGRYHEYNNHGILQQEGNYKTRQKDGQWTYYRNDGSLDTQISYQDGVPHGLYIGYNTQGGKIIEGNYLHGQEHGGRKTYEDDVIVVEEEYYQGKKIYYKDYKKEMVRRYPDYKKYQIPNHEENNSEIID